MLDRLFDLLSGKAPAPEQSSEESLRLSVAALLVEAALMDEDFDEGERAAVKQLLADRFELTPDDAEALLAAAEARVSTSDQYYPYTREVSTQMSADQKSEVIEMLWRVVYADGVLDPHEDMLVRQIAGLIHVTDRERALARQRAMKKLGLS